MTAAHTKIMTLKMQQPAADSEYSGRYVRQESDIEDYKSRGKNVDSEYAKFLEENKKKKVISILMISRLHMKMVLTSTL